ncbi:hypothetical protein [Nonomuraea fuscirosea]|uniref:hypothetical protein n=1 Tax=Nonomuraea fuscirosea TaxID=1291556 RepID=UPI00340C5B14
MTEEPEWARALNRVAADLTKGLTHAGNILGAQAAMGWAFRGDLVNTRSALVGMSPAQLQELSAAASFLGAVADEALSAQAGNGGGDRRQEGQLAEPSVEDWERGPDAASGVGERSARVEGRVLLLHGDAAVVVTPFHPQGDPLRVPAVGLAEQLGIDVQQLPGRRFCGEIVDDCVVWARLIG